MSLTSQPPPLSCNEESIPSSFISNLVENAKQLNQCHFLSITFETEYSDPLAILEEVHDWEIPVCYMERPANEFSIAAVGFLTSAIFYGDERFHQARIWSDALFDKTIVAGDHKVSGTGPTIFLSATFESLQESDLHPPPLEVFLAKWQVVRKGGSNFLIANFEITPTSCPVAISEELNTYLEKVKGLRFNASVAPKPQDVKIGHPYEKFDYEDAVEKAISQIDDGCFDKVVLARQLHFKTSDKLPSFSIAHALREKFPDCHTFCISSPKHGLMVGATPEMLLRTAGENIETEALAGSAPRGMSAGRDALWAKTLLGREKEIREHNLVIQSILRRLASIGIDDCHEGKPRLLRLANLQHAKTPLRAKVEGSIHPFEILSVLHPTPAMGGSPREAALPLVRKLEKQPRGWYSGVLGWMDNRSRGEFVVPIRCGKISSNNLTLYAGAGLVKGSNPRQEKLETDWKLQAMLEVITGKTCLP